MPSKNGYSLSPELEAARNESYIPETQMQLQARPSTDKEELAPFNLLFETLDSILKERGLVYGAALGGLTLFSGYFLFNTFAQTSNVFEVQKKLAKRYIARISPDRNEKTRVHLMNRVAQFDHNLYSQRKTLVFLGAKDSTETMWRSMNEKTGIITMDFTGVNSPVQLQKTFATQLGCYHPLSFSIPSLEDLLRLLDEAVRKRKSRTIFIGKGISVKYGLPKFLRLFFRTLCDEDDLRDLSVVLISNDTTARQLYKAIYHTEAKLDQFGMVLEPEESSEYEVNLAPRELNAQHPQAASKYYNPASHHTRQRLLDVEARGKELQHRAQIDIPKQRMYPKTDFHNIDPIYLEEGPQQQDAQNNIIQRHLNPDESRKRVDPELKKNRDEYEEFLEKQKKQQQNQRRDQGPPEKGPRPPTLYISSYDEIPASLKKEISNSQLPPLPKTGWKFEVLVNAVNFGLRQSLKFVSKSKDELPMENDVLWGQPTVKKET